MSARTALAVALVVLLSLLLGCTAVAPPATPASQPAGSPAAKAASPKAPAGPSGKVILASGAPQIQTMNPGDANATTQLRILWPMYDALTWVDGEGQPQPALASGWRTIDPTTWEFTLRDDISFHNGRSVTADDVVDTVAYYRNPDNALVVARTFVTVDQVTAPDDRTVRITTRVVDPTLPQILGTALILPAQEFQAAGAERFFESPIGTGAFRPVRVDFPNGVAYELVEPLGARVHGTPAIREVEWRFIPEEATRLAALSTGEIDVVVDLSPDGAVAAQRDGLKPAIDPGASTAHYALDPEGPTADIRVRKAMNHAVDKEQMIRELNAGFGEADGQLIDARVLGYNPDIEPYAYDPELARELLSEAGLADGFTIPLTSRVSPPAGKEHSEAVAAFLDAVGIRTEISLVENAQWIGQYFGPQEGRRGMWAQVISFDTTWEPNYTWRWYTSDVPLPAGRRWVDEEFDAMYQRAKTTLDREERDRLYREAGAYLHDQAWVLFLFTNVRPGAAQQSITWEPTVQVADMFSRIRKADQ